MARVIITKVLKKSVKVTAGDLIQETPDRVTAAIIDDKGNKTIKNYSKAKHMIQILN